MIDDYSFLDLDNALRIIDVNLVYNQLGLHSLANDQQFAYENSVFTNLKTKIMENLKQIRRE